jgi:hypothetical protein
MLTLPEQWIILALDEKTGNLKIPRSVFQCGITGGMLLELAIAKRIELTEEKKMAVLDNSNVEDPLLNKTLSLIAKSKKPQTLLNWMIQLTMQNSRTIEALYFKQMVKQNDLKKESHKVLGIINNKRHIPVSKDIRSEIVDSLTKIIHGQTPNEVRSLCLLGLVAKSGQMDQLLGREEVSLITKNSTSIFSILEEKILSTKFISFNESVLNALSLTQQSAGGF